MQLVSRFSRLFVLCLLMTLHAFAKEPAPDSKNEQSLRDIGERVCQALQKKDFASVYPMLAENVLISERRAYWTREDGNMTHKQVQSNNPGLLDDLAPVIWVEREVTLSKDDQKEANKLRVALQRISSRIQDTYGTLDASLELKDAWGVRVLGPAAGGKLASSNYWYIYFRKRGAGWSIWKIEFASH